MELNWPNQYVSFAPHPLSHPAGVHCESGNSIKAKRHERVSAAQDLLETCFAAKKEFLFYFASSKSSTKDNCRRMTRSSEGCVFVGELDCLLLTMETKQQQQQRQQQQQQKLFLKKRFS